MKKLPRAELMVDSSRDAGQQTTWRTQIFKTSWPSSCLPSSLPSHFLSVFLSLLPAYFKTSTRDHVTVQYNNPGRGGELVGVCTVQLCAWVRGRRITLGGKQLEGYFYRRGLLSGLALTGAVWCASQWPAKSIYLVYTLHDVQQLGITYMANENG